MHYIYCSVFDPILNDVDCMMRSVRLEFAFTPPNWYYITDVEILKQAGRINNKLVGKKVLANAEMCNGVAEEQHESRKYHQAGLLGLNKVLIGDIF